jgi:hypothetical protein
VDFAAFFAGRFFVFAIDALLFHSRAWLVNTASI